MNLLDLPGDILGEIEGYLDQRSGRTFAQVSRAYNTRFTEALKSLHYFRLVSSIAHDVPFSGRAVIHRTGSLWTAEDFPPFGETYETLLMQSNYPADTRDRLVILSVQEIDLTSVGSRSWYLNGANSPPLLPLEIALHYRKPGALRFPPPKQTRRNKRARDDDMTKTPAKKKARRK